MSRLEFARRDPCCGDNGLSAGGGLSTVGCMYRTGLGYDSHRFAPGRRMMLGGVEIPGELGLAGHSDADAVLHAITDAVLGAIGAGDIGEMFPDDDPRFADADSAAFVAAATGMARQGGWRVTHCDVTILAETPRLVGHKPAMRARIAELLELDPANVSVKAKTNEGMGFVGRREGLAVMAAATITDEFRE